MRLMMRRLQQHPTPEGASQKVRRRHRAHRARLHGGHSHRGLCVREACHHRHLPTNSSVASCRCTRVVHVRRGSPPPASPPNASTPCSPWAVTAFMPRQRRRTPSGRCRSPTAMASDRLLRRSSHTPPTRSWSASPSTRAASRASTGSVRAGVARSERRGGA